MFNIYVIKNLDNGHHYIDYTKLSLNKQWKELLQNYEQGTDTLSMAMKHYGINKFKISVLEEYYKQDVEERMKYWFNRYSPEYNQEVIIDYNNTKRSTSKHKHKWGYNRKHKPSPKHPTNTIKCRCIKTGKLKTLHGWKAAAAFCNGKVDKIKSSIARDGTAYGYKWWIYKRAKDNKRPVYGVHKEGHVTTVFDSITNAMIAMGGDDRGKGICTSIKWKQRWKGYMWYYH